MNGAPQPVATLDHEFLGELNGKPAGIVTCLPGTDFKDVDTGHCATTGALLAQMHIAGAGYDAQMVNPRGPVWWQSALPKVLPFMEPDAAALLTQEVRFQACCQFDDLPRGYRVNVNTSEAPYNRQLGDAPAQPSRDLPAG